MARADLDDSISDKPEFFGDVREKWTKVRAFWRTKKAVRAGKNLHDFTKEELRRQNYQGPWLFNLAESAVAALPALVATKVLQVLYPARQEPLFLAEPQGAFAEAVQEIQQELLSWMSPLLIPLTLLISAYGFAWASLKPKDSTPQSRRRARRAYLYLDGAYGLVPQTLVVLGISIGLALLERQVPSADHVGIICLVLVGIGGWWAFYLTTNRIPSTLFQLHRYSGRVRHFWRLRASENVAPWNRYHLMALFGAPLTGWLLFLVMTVVATGTAMLGAWVRLRIAS